MAGMNRMLCVALVCVVFLALGSTAAWAGPYGSAGGVRPIAPSCLIHPPELYPGKEYSHNTDMDSVAGADPEQNILWDGTGGVADGFDYSGSRLDDPDGQVDALANRMDALFWEVFNDEVPLVFSVEQNECAPMHASGPESLYFETPTLCPSSNVWVAPGQVDQHACGQITPYDLDGVEIWGRSPDSLPESPVNDRFTGGLDGPGNEDATYYSLVGDPVDPVNPGMRVSVWGYDPVAGVSFPYVGSSQLKAAVVGLFGEEFEDEDFDLDAMMVWDDVNPGVIDPGADAILFSLRPVNQVIDGGEIIFWDYTTNPAAYLFHGGHLWDRTHDVGIDPHDLETLGNWNGDANVDAIEALPEPATLGLLAVGALALIRRKR